MHKSIEDGCIREAKRLLWWALTELEHTRLRQSHVWIEIEDALSGIEMALVNKEELVTASARKINPKKTTVERLRYQVEADRHPSETVVVRRDDLLEVVGALEQAWDILKYVAGVSHD